MSNYLKIPAIIKEIEAHAQKMEDGKLSLEELTQLLDYSRQLNERVAILRYKALTGNSKPMESKSVENKGITKEQILQEISTKPKEESKKEEEGFSFDFTSSDGVVGIEPTTQRSLLDQIKELFSHEKVILYRYGPDNYKTKLFEDILRKFLRYLDIPLIYSLILN